MRTLLALLLVGLAAANLSEIYSTLCNYEKLPPIFYGTWTREPNDPARPLTITWATANGQPGFSKYVLTRGANPATTYVVAFDAEWRDNRRWFMLNPRRILLEKMINGQIYQERMTIQQNGLYRIEGQDEVQTFNITLKRV